MNPKYKKILHLPHHVSKEFPPMSLRDRAAQFSPFAAMVGHDAMIEEAARYVEERPELDEVEQERLNGILLEALAEAAEVEVTYFVPDEKKQGGTCQIVRGRIRKYDPLADELTMANGQKIRIYDLIGAISFGYPAPDGFRTPIVPRREGAVVRLE